MKTSCHQVVFLILCCLFAELYSHIRFFPLKRTIFLTKVLHYDHCLNASVSKTDIGSSVVFPLFVGHNELWKAILKLQ